ncbi:CDP-diacylglycerol--glycerol-3-phosphate 3-phosphatidyltransferase [Acidaminobacter sp. JC074]|uniref:CDP-diacylglycerol--glycerol-3-phosphate 3-phosphatidyltransferase n=1 Tax=Acidaminobacter sp. JC074 TaxID=2530199 RepID=UPI001F0F0412|nr:CDP-diacylglycerol--glycerol-3-phosphate 3-phosphatidyltransferase [Acidaminobacter sp. JC074]MCH4890928.1 CDP-diacylglycerol--glycerol-3-phosphate 3-phosphatidyltransferase [Acidaminobacter sp. JC074]
MNLANRLTLLRVIMIPFFVFFLLKGDPTNMAIAGGIFILASITDFLDGYIARSRNLVTKFGKFMDPLADKLLVMSAFICLVELQIVPSWIVIVILAREFIVSIFRAIAASEGIVIAAGKLGKYKTTTQMIAIILLCFGNFPFNSLNIPVDQFFLYLCAILTILSGLDYILKNKEVLKEN